MKIGFLTACLPECSVNDVTDFSSNAINVAKLDKKGAGTKWRLKC